MKLGVDSLWVVKLQYASFLNAAKMNSKLGFVLQKVDGLVIDNIVFHMSIRGLRVTRSVLIAEVQALVHAFDHSYIIQNTLGELRG